MPNFYQSLQPTLKLERIIIDHPEIIDHPAYEQIKKLQDECALEKQNLQNSMRKAVQITNHGHTSLFLKACLRVNQTNPLVTPEVKNEAEKFDIRKIRIFA